jgi:hypothetical protein
VQGRKLGWLRDGEKMHEAWNLFQFWGWILVGVSLPKFLFSINKKMSFSTSGSSHFMAIKNPRRCHLTTTLDHMHKKLT